MTRPTPNRVVTWLLLGALTVGAALYTITLLRLPSHPFMAALISAARNDPMVQQELGNSFTVSMKSGFARQRGRSARLYTGELHLVQRQRACFVRGRSLEPETGSPFVIRKLFVRCRNR